MKKVDFFTGETPLEDVSPPVSHEEAMVAQIRNYNYGGPPVNIGGVGYNNYGYTGPPYQGIGYNYGYYQPPDYTYPGYNPYTPQPNPAFGMGNQYIQAKDVTVNIPAYNPWGSEYLLPANFEKEVFELQWKYWVEQQQHQAAAQIRQPVYGQPNYYGWSNYSTPYMYNNTGNQYIEKIKEIKDKARQERIDLNVELSRLAHNYLGQEFDEDKIRELYTGKTVTIPGITNIDIYDDNRLRNLIPFDNSQAYREHDAKVSAEFRKRVSPDADMNTCFENLAMVNYDYEMEDELHRRRRDLKSSYDSNTYKTLIRQKVFDEMDPSTQVRDMKTNLLGSGMFPTLSQNARLADDGTLKITYSYNQNQPIMNMNESQYQQEKARFNAFLNSIPDSIGGGNRG